MMADSLALFSLSLDCWRVVGRERILEVAMKKKKKKSMKKLVELILLKKNEKHLCSIVGHWYRNGV